MICFFWNSGMPLSLVYISYAFEMFGLNFKRNRTVSEKPSYFQHCRRMKSHVPSVDFPAEALGWLILRFRWLPCLSQLSLTEPSLGARMELDSPFQRGLGLRSGPLLAESCRLGDPSETHRGQWASREWQTEVLYYKWRAVIFGGRRGRLGCYN